MKDEETLAQIGAEYLKDDPDRDSTPTWKNMLTEIDAIYPNWSETVLPTYIDAWAQGMTGPDYWLMYKSNHYFYLTAFRLDETTLNPLLFEVYQPVDPSSRNSVRYHYTNLADSCLLNIKKNELEMCFTHNSDLNTTLDYDLTYTKPEALQAFIKGWNLMQLKGKSV